MRAGIGHAVWRPSSRARRAEGGADVRAVEQARPTAPSCPGCGGCRRAARRSRRWPGRRAAGTTRRSPGRRSASNHTNRSSAAGPSTSRDVLAEGVPLAEVAGSAERRAPCAPGSTCRRRRRRSGPRSGRGPSTPTHDVVAALVERAVEPVALQHGGAGLDGDVDEGVVELQAGRDGGERARRPAAAARGPGGRSASAARRRRRPASRRPRPGRTRAARARAAPSVVSPSPQHLSRGNTALSTTTTSRPARGQRHRRRGARRPGPDDHARPPIDTPARLRALPIRVFVPSECGRAGRPARHSDAPNTRMGGIGPFGYGRSLRAGSTSSSEEQSDVEAV